MERTLPCPDCGLEVNAEEKVCPRCNTLLIPQTKAAPKVDPKYPSLDDNSGRVRQHDSGLTDAE